MDTNDLIKQLANLMQLDIDAVEAYNQALQNIDDTIIHAQISSFRNDHLGHINSLTHLITGLGGTAPERTKDFKGFLIKGFTAIRSLTGTLGALKAMESNEKMTNEAYENALIVNLPEDVRVVLEKNYSDERRHLAYIQEVLAKS